MKDDKVLLNDSVCLPSTLAHLFYGDQAFSILLPHHPHHRTAILTVTGGLLHLQPSHLLPKQQEGRRTKGLQPNRSSSYQT